MTVETAEIGLWVALTLWVVGFVLSVFSLVFRKEKLLFIAVILAGAGYFLWQAARGFGAW